MTEIKSLIRTISRISDNFSAVRQQILDNHPNFDQTKDSRITTFTNCIVVLDGIYICLIVRGFELRKIGVVALPIHFCVGLQAAYIHSPFMANLTAA